MKVFESIAGRTGCAKVMFADVQIKLAADLPVLVLVAKLAKNFGTTVQTDWQVFADDIRDWL